MNAYENQGPINIPPPYSSAPPRADFSESRYGALIAQHGVDVQVEEALQCACKTKSNNNLNTCQNCGGTGWIFVNPRQTRMVAQGMGISKDYTPWSEESKGMIRFSALPEEELCFMDRITRLNAISHFNEVLEFKEKGSTIFAYTAYNLKKIKCLGFYTGDTTIYRWLKQDIDYTFSKNKIILLDGIELPETERVTATIRYSHAPVFHVEELTRESVENFYWDGKEKIQYLPSSGVARRAHFIKDMENLSNNRMLNNDYDEPNCNCQ
jgi:hypothetical protein